MKQVLSHTGKELQLAGLAKVVGLDGVVDHINLAHLTNPIAKVVLTSAVALHRNGRQSHEASITEHIENAPSLRRILESEVAPDWKQWGARTQDDLAFNPLRVRIAQDHLSVIAESAREREAKQVVGEHIAGQISRAELLERLTRIEEDSRVESGDVSDLFADVDKILSAGLEPERPTIAEYSNGEFLFYAGRLNEIHGEPGTGKSNINLLASMTVLATGRPVLYIDPEDSAEAAVRRLIGFGCTEDVIRDHFKHTRCPAGNDYVRLASWAKANKPPLVIVDGLAEALAADGLSEDKPEDFLRFCRERLQPFTDAGAAVVLSDHVVKSAENRGRWSRGTGAKLGRYDGVAYQVELGRGYSPTVEGFVRLSVAKDRNGGVGVVGQAVTEIHFSPMETGLTRVTFKKPKGQSEGRFMPTSIMAKVSRQLEAVPTSSTRDLRALGKSDYVDQSIQELVAMGHLEVIKGGIGKQTKYRLLKPFREGDLDV